MRRWRGWWKVANREQLVTFVLLTIAGIVVLSVLAYSTVYGQDIGEAFAFVEAEGQALKVTVASSFGTVFWLGGTVVVALLNGGDEVTVKRPYRAGDEVRLVPQNGDHKEIVLPAEEVRIQGEVVFVLHPPHRR